MQVTDESRFSEVEAVMPVSGWELLWDADTDQAVDDAVANKLIEGELHGEPIEDYPLAWSEYTDPEGEFGPQRYRIYRGQFMTAVFVEVSPQAIKLYATEALPAHYVAEDASGTRYLIPVDPIGPGCWERRTPYRGNYTLQPVPDYVAKFYQPEGATT